LVRPNSMTRAIAGSESSFPLIPLRHFQQIVGFSDIKCSVVAGLGELHQCFSNQGKGVAILDSAFIQSPIFNI